MPTRKKIGFRRNRTHCAMKGGFSDSKDMWSYGVCKMLVDALGDVPTGVKKNWLDCLIHFAERAGMTPEDLFNKITPDEFLTKIGRAGVFGVKNVYGRYPVPYNKYQAVWDNNKRNRDAALAQGKAWGSTWELRLSPLPGNKGKPLTEEQLTAAKEKAVERERQAFFAQPSSLRENAPREYNQRVRELEEGASEAVSEECYGHSSADPGLCLAAHKGTAKRIARRERELRERARRRALNAHAGENWGAAQGPLVALAAKYANKPENFAAVYNGVSSEPMKVKKWEPLPPAFKPHTGTWLTGRNINRTWDPVKTEAERVWTWNQNNPKDKYRAERNAQWKSPPHQTGDFLLGSARAEIMEQTYPEFPASGPNKKLPERVLYDQIATALKTVRYEKGYEDPVTHQPQLDVYDQALSRAQNWRRKGIVTL